MLSTNYRLRLEVICEAISKNEEVSFDDMLWADKLAKHNLVAQRMMNQARRLSVTPDMQIGDMDDFLNRLDLGDPDPSNHKTSFNSPEEIADWFRRKDTELGDERRRRD